MYQLKQLKIFLIALFLPAVCFLTNLEANDPYGHVSPYKITLADLSLHEHINDIESFFNSDNELITFTIALPDNQFNKTLTVYVYKRYVHLEHPSFYFGEYEFFLLKPTGQEVINGIQEAIKTIK